MDYKKYHFDNLQSVFHASGSYFFGAFSFAGFVLIFGFNNNIETNHCGNGGEVVRKVFKSSYPKPVLFLKFVRLMYKNISFNYT